MPAAIHIVPESPRWVRASGVAKVPMAAPMRLVARCKVRRRLPDL